MKLLKKLIDMQSLGGFIKMLETNYDKTMLQQARNFFITNNQIHMANFLTEDSYLELKKNISQKSLKKDYKADEKSRNIGSIDSEIGDKLIILIEKIINEKIKKFSAKIGSYEHRDYKLLKDGQEKRSNEIFFCIDLTSEWDNKFGGEDHIFIDENELIFSVIPNSFLVINNMNKHYVKYINCLAKNKKRVVIFGEFVLNN